MHAARVMRHTHSAQNITRRLLKLSHLQQMPLEGFPLVHLAECIAHRVLKQAERYGADLYVCGVWWGAANNTQVDVGGGNACT